jgi:hypothetical protein
VQPASSVAPASGPTPSASGIGGVKADDEVSLQATGTGGKLTATAIQDPASLP